MRIIELWHDDDNTDFLLEDESGGRSEISSYNHDEIGGAGYDVLKDAMQTMAALLNIDYVFEESNRWMDDE